MKNFFRDRLLELLHKDTLDSYRVKVNNSNSLLYELHQLLNDWKAGKIKQFETVQISCEELLDSLKSDECFSYGDYNKQIIFDELDAIKKNGKDLNLGYIQHILFHLIQLNRDEYLKTLFSSIEMTLKENPEQEYFLKMDRLLNNIVAELLRIGYSKYFLYNMTKAAFSKSDFDSQFDTYKKRLMEKKKDLFHVFFKLTFDKVDNIPSYPDLIKNIETEFISSAAQKRNPAFFSHDDKTRYLYLKENVLDANTALVAAKLNLATLLDKIHLTMDSIQIEVYKSTYITSEPYSQKGNCKHTDYIVDGYKGKRNTFDKKNS